MTPKRPLFRSRSSSIFISLVASLVLLASCGTLTPKSPAVSGPILSSPTPQTLLDTPTIVPPSPTPGLVDTATFTPSPTVALPTDTPILALPSPTLQAAAASSAPAGSLTLVPGTTAGIVKGTLQPGQVITYTLGAERSQALTLIMDSPNNDVTLGVSEPNGNFLLSPAGKQTAFQMTLPATELYTIQITGGATEEDYSLTFKLPKVVQFATGATSATVNGTTVNGYLFSYSFHCGAGQTMAASLNVPASTAILDIFGVNSGATLLDTPARANTWTGSLPNTQDYVIEVVPVNGQVVDFALTVSVTGAITESSSDGQNVAFTPGTTAAVYNGTVGAGEWLTYTLQAGRAQALILRVESPKMDVVLRVTDPDGNLLLGSLVKYSHWQTQIPKTGLYTIQVIGGKAASKYTLTVKLAQLVYFPTGGTTVTLHGNTWNGYVHSYVFLCSAGQIMTATLNTPPTKASLDIFGVRTGVILNYLDHATTWTGTLADTQEYVVEVVPRGGYLVSYTLTVTIP